VGDQVIPYSSLHIASVAEVDHDSHGKVRYRLQDEAGPDHLFTRYENEVMPYRAKKQEGDA
jgi:hypothetical protein